MNSLKKSDSFLGSFDLCSNERLKTDVVAIIGAGGKTSLLFALAKEAKTLGKNVLVTTTTHMWQLSKGQYDLIDLSGCYNFNIDNNSCGSVCVGGLVANDHAKMTAGDLSRLEKVITDFDLVLIEADGAAGKPLKGWKENEPVVPHFTTHTLGVIDISSVGMTINDKHVHRLEIFRRLMEDEAEKITICHLQNLIRHKKGLFHTSRGKQILYLNKMESKMSFQQAQIIKERFVDLMVVGGSILNNDVYV